METTICLQDIAYALVQAEIQYTTGQLEAMGRLLGCYENPEEDVAEMSGIQQDLTCQLDRPLPDGDEEEEDEELIPLEPWETKETLDAQLDRWMMGYDKPWSRIPQQMDETDDDEDEDDDEFNYVPYSPTSEDLDEFVLRRELTKKRKRTE